MELFERKETTYIERADGTLKMGNSKALTEGGYIELTIGIETFTVPIDENGFWTWQPTTPYADGNYSLSISHIDMAGNRNKPTLATIVIDSTPPEAPELLNLFDDQGAVTGSFDAGKATDDKRPTLTGIAQKGATVYLRDADGNNIGSAVADKISGKWVMEPSQDLNDGENSLTLVAVETFAKQQREGTASEPFTIIIAGDAVPTGVTITDAFDNAGSATGALSSGALTDDTTPTLRGTAAGSSSVLVYFRLAGSDIWAGSATVAVTDGKWSWTPGSALATGNYEFQASSGDIASALFSLEIASAEQIAQRTRIESARDDFGQDQGPLADGAITDDATPTLYGRAEANGRVVIRYTLESGSAASVIVDADSAGNWRWTPAADLAAGLWSFEVQPQGAARWSNAFKLEITGSGENSYAPTIAYAYDDFGSSTGERKSGSTTDDTTPTLHGKAAANSVVYLQAIHGEEVQTFSVLADASSQWEWTPPTELELGDWKFQVSKGAGEGFGDAFELKIGQAGSYTNIIDFEILPEDLPPAFVRAQYYKFKENMSLMFYNTTAYTAPLAKFVTPQNFNDPSFGSASLYLPRNEVVVFHAPKFDDIYDFSVQIFNPDNVSRNVQLGIGYNGSGYAANFALDPGVHTITYAEVRAIWGLPDNYLIGEVSINVGSPINTPSGILIDNFSWITKLESGIPSFSSLEDDSIHQLSGIEELNNTIVIGHDNQGDTLKITSQDQLLDLTTQGDRIQSVEIFDITGTGDNTLKLDLTALLQHGEKDLFIEDGKTQLMVKGNEGDVVELVDILPEGSDISEWQHQEGTVNVAGVEYNVYTHGDDAELLVQQGVKTELV